VERTALRTRSVTNKTRICVAEMALRYSALNACRKYIRDASGAEKSLPMATITGRTDRQTDRVRRNMRPPPREEGRIIKLETTASSHEGQCIPAGSSVSLPRIVLILIYDQTHAAPRRRRRRRQISRAAAADNSSSARRRRRT